jgi:DNA-binding GntR family transcriptional regulator
MYPAGTELKDTTIAAEFRVARPTARVAVQRLVAEGLLERPPGHSARVRQFTAADVRDIYRLRRLLEFESIEIVMAERKSTRGVAGALDHFRAVGINDSWEAGPDADTAFHSAVVRATDSERLRRMFGLLSSEMRLMIALLRPHYGSLTELYDEHADLLNALESGDEVRARTLWRSHLDDAERFLIDAVAGG